VIFVVPAIRPLIVPLVEPTVATVVFDDTHVPPGVVVVSVPVAASHT